MTKLITSRRPLVTVIITTLTLWVFSSLYLGLLHTTILAPDYYLNNFTLFDYGHDDDSTPVNNRDTTISSSSGAYLTMYGSHRVAKAKANLPKWVQNYIDWHANERANPTEKTRYLLIGCLKNTNCGGTSDRLRSLPYFFLVANMTQRVLLFKWTKPTSLEEFLTPPEGGLDWRVPMTGMEPFSELEDGKNPYVKGLTKKMFNACREYNDNAEQCTYKAVGEDLKSNDKYVLFNRKSAAFDSINDSNNFVQKLSYGEGNYVGARAWEYIPMFGDLFRVMFEPVPALKQMINDTMTSLHLVEDEFNSAHVRARYPAQNMPLIENKDGQSGRNAVDKTGGLIFEGRLKYYIVDVARNAVACVAKLAPKKKIFFASDSNDTSAYLLEYQNEVFKDSENPIEIVTIDRKDEPLHIDHDGWVGRPASDFFSGFEDLLIMGGSSCVAHGIGSFGSFGAGLIGNRCKVNHRKYNGVKIPCSQYGDANLRPSEIP